MCLSYIYKSILFYYIMNIVDIENYIDYIFIEPPLVVGGLALDYHNVRKCGYDYDYMVSGVDWINLREKYPNNINLFGGKDEDEIDATINLNINGKHIDLIKTLWKYDYNYLSQNSINIIEDKIKIISLENILFIKSLPALKDHHKKSMDDLRLIIDKVVDNKYY
jgi:hypothetical protein